MSKPNFSSIVCQKKGCQLSRQISEGFQERAYIGRKVATREDLKEVKKKNRVLTKILSAEKANSAEINTAHGWIKKLTLHFWLKPLNLVRQSLKYNRTRPTKNYWTNVDDWKKIYQSRKRNYRPKVFKEIQDAAKFRKVEKHTYEKKTAKEIQDVAKLHMGSRK